MNLRDILNAGFGSRFGHFATAASPVVLAAAAASAEESEEAKRAREAKECDENEKETGKRETHAARAAREEQEEKDARKAKKTKRAKRSAAAKANPQDDDDADDAGDDDEDDDDEDDMKKAASAGHGAALDAAFRLGARSQRKRCAAILACEAAGLNPVLAMSLAFETSMTPAAAVAVLEKSSAAPRGTTLANRMAGSAAATVRVGPSAQEGPKGPVAVAQSWDTAMKAFMPGA